MLKEATITQIATLAKIDPAVLKAAITATDEQDVAIPADLQVLTKTEFETRDRNKYNEGKKAGEEMSLKELKEKAKIDGDVADFEKMIDAISKKAVEDAKIAPDEQVKEARKLVDQWKQKATAAEQAAEDLKRQTAQLAADNKIRSLLPKNRADILTDDEYLGSLKSRFSIETKDNREVVIDRTTGDVVRDKTKLEPIAPADVIKSYFTERKWEAVEDAGGKGGRGGKDSTPGAGAGKFAKASEVKKWIEDQGKNLNGIEGQNMFKAAIKENPDMDMSA